MPHYNTIAEAIRFIRQQAASQPSLALIADHVGLSESRLQRVFSEWAGISPKKFLQFLTKEYAKKRLRDSDSVLDSALQSGLSGGGRLHDLFITYEGMSPGSFKRYGRGIELYFGKAPSPFGEALFVWTDLGLCKLAFVDSAQTESSIHQSLELEWPAAKLLEDRNRARAYSEQIFATLPPESRQPLHLLLSGSPFQLKVWEALLQVGSGNLVSYAQLARLSGTPKAARAVGSCMAANRIAYLIPCHRVIRNDGDVGQYLWGSERKLAMLAREANLGQQPV